MKWYHVVLFVFGVLFLVFIANTYKLSTRPATVCATPECIMDELALDLAELENLPLPARVPFPIYVPRTGPIVTMDETLGAWTVDSPSLYCFPLKED